MVKYSSVYIENIVKQLRIFADNETISKEEPFDYEDLAFDTTNAYSDASNSSLLIQERDQRHFVDISTLAEPTLNTERRPATKKRKASLNSSSNSDQLTPFEKAMLEIERDRSERLERIAQQRLKIMRRMAAENSDFHSKIIALMKSKK
ncbi:GH16636 [Drosophila grimshawi]|uniref:GH16636 n=1 Tax=Drosophila grimshawi TaxID=7222 RepID=B4J2K7_DROGR|nr:GH16636 [Drosophila grimshawi]